MIKRDSKISFITDKGFIIQINSKGEISGKKVYYLNPQCSGDKYVLTTDAILSEIFKSYNIHEGDDTETLVYIPKNSLIVYEAYYHYREDGYCYLVSYSNTHNHMIKVFLNDPNITNISDDFEAPISISK